MVQLEELLAVRHSVFVLGPAGTGKTQVCHVLWMINLYYGITNILNGWSWSWWRTILQRNLPSQAHTKVCLDGSLQFHLLHQPKPISSLQRKRKISIVINSTKMPLWKVFKAHLIMSLLGHPYLKQDLPESKEKAIITRPEPKGCNSRRIVWLHQSSYSRMERW